MFGSFANGTYNDNSDYDFYIIVDSKEENIFDLTTKAYKSVRKIKNRPIDIVISTEELFLEKSIIPSLENKVKNEGVLIYDQGNQTLD